MSIIFAKARKSSCPFAYFRAVLWFHEVARCMSEFEGVDPLPPVRWVSRPPIGGSLPTKEDRK